MIIFIFVATLVITAIVCLVRSIRQSGPPLTQDERVRVSQAISKNIQENSRHSFEAARLQAPIVHILDKGISVDEVAERAALYGRDMRPATTGNI